MQITEVIHIFLAVHHKLSTKSEHAPLILINYFMLEKYKVDSKGSPKPEEIETFNK